MDVMVAGAVALEADSLEAAVYANLAAKAVDVEYKVYKVKVVTVAMEEEDIM